jgi:hypothetical protein
VSMRAREPPNAGVRSRKACAGEPSLIEW